MGFRQWAIVALSLAILATSCFAQSVQYFPVYTIQEGAVTAGGYTYFNTTVQIDVGKYAYITISPLSGDPDLVVNVCGNWNNCPLPTTQSAQYNQNSGQGDFLQIPQTACQNYPTCIFSIGVYGYSASHFTLTVTYLPWGPNNLKLIEGLPQDSYADYHSSSYFQFCIPAPTPISPNQNFTVTITPLTDGDPDLYMSTTNTQPGPGTPFTWSSNNYGSDYLYIRTNDAHYLQNGGCYYVGVYGWSAVEFAITAFRDGQTPQLMDTVPITQSINQHTYAYFQFYLETSQSISFSLTPLSANSDADLYISATIPEPTSATATWRSIRVGADEVVISATDSHLPTPNYAGWFYVSVYGYTNVEFVIVAQTLGSSVVLPNGTPLFGVVLPNMYQYYRFAHTDLAADIDITVQAPSGGEPWLYMSASKVNPSHGNADFSCEWTTGTCRIFVNASNTVAATYFISVFGGPNTAPTGSGFYISGVNSLSTLTLVDGQPVIDSLPQGAYRYYRYSLQQPLDFTVAVAALYGDPDLYVSSINAHPNNSVNGWQWRSFHTGSDSVTVTTNDPKYTSSNPYYIAVYGYKQSGFVVTAFSSNSTVSLPDGLPVSGIVQADAYVYYSFYIASAGQLSISLSILDAGADADLYVSSPSSGILRPTSMANTFASNNYGGDSIYQTITETGTWMIGVNGFTACNFTITASHAYAILPDNRYITTDTVLGALSTFHVDVPSIANAPNGVSMSLTLFTGYTTLVASNLLDPISITNSSSFQVSSSTWPGNAVTLPAAAALQRWQVAVYGNATSHYTISATTGHARLTSGVPRFDVVVPGSTNYYQISIPTVIGPSHATARSDEYLTVKMIGGAVAVYAHTSVVNPSPSSYMFSSTSPGDHFLLLPRAQLNTSILYIAVIGVEPAVQASSSSMLSGDEGTARYNLLTFPPGYNVSLAIDQPTFYQSGAAGSAASFSFGVTPDATVLVAVTASCSNAPPPQLYADSTAMTSGPVYATRRGFTQFVTIQNPPVTAGNPSTLYRLVATSAVDNSPYAIYASTVGDGAPNNVRPVAGGPISYSINKDRQLQLSWAPAGSAANFGPVQYRVYMTQVSSPDDLNVINMEVPCALLMSDAALTDWISFYPDSDGMIRQTLIPSGLAAHTLFAVNIVARNSLGLQAAYQPIVINSDHHPVLSGGSIFLIVLAVCTFTYFAGGYAYKYYRGSRGIEAIPNIDFWRDVPTLVADGFKFAKNGFKREEGYEVVNGNDGYPVSAVSFANQDMSLNDMHMDDDVDHSAAGRFSYGASL